MPQRPIYGQAYELYVALRSYSDNNKLLNDPVVAGKVSVSVDGGALAAITNAPAVDPAGSPFVKLSLTAAEMTGDNVNIRISDVGNAFADHFVSIQPQSSQSRVNRPAGRAFQLRASSRNDGTHVTDKPIRLRDGTVGTLAVSVDMQPLFGDLLVQSVGTPVISSGNITATALGPRDTQAMVELGGTAAAMEEVQCTFRVTMETEEAVDITFHIIVFSE